MGPSCSEMSAKQHFSSLFVIKPGLQSVLKSRCINVVLLDFMLYEIRITQLTPFTISPVRDDRNEDCVIKFNVCIWLNNLVPALEALRTRISNDRSFLRIIHGVYNADFNI
jgi:hypothetical protein